jgi:uncharacterized protein YndB with AHSA1/START domain
MMVKGVTLPLAPPQAFELFAGGIDAWWPPERRHTDDPMSQIFLLESGRFYERAGDGREVELGKVRAWDYPRRILLDFFVASGPDRPTEVEITFQPQDTATRVTVTHRPKPESEALWEGRAPRYAQSWELVLAALRAACLS